MGYVLVIEDDVDAAEIMTRVLEISGHEYKHASNGLQALDVIHERQPDLILLDLMMPGMDGFQLLTRLRSFRELRKVPVVVISGLGDQGGRVSKLAGVNRVMQKSGFSIQEFRSMLAEFLPG